jgi:hypothetical protein
MTGGAEEPQDPSGWQTAPAGRALIPHGRRRRVEWLPACIAAVLCALGVLVGGWTGTVAMVSSDAAAETTAEEAGTGEATSEGRRVRAEHRRRGPLSLRFIRRRWQRPRSRSALRAPVWAVRCIPRRGPPLSNA